MAGAHIDVALPGELSRRYSLINPPQPGDRYVIAVSRDPNSRGGSPVSILVTMGCLLE